MDFREHLMPYAIRKPAAWDEIPDATNKLKDWCHEMLRRLPRIETDVEPWQHFLGETPPIECVALVAGEAFYVNPEGYPYARYAFKFNP